jgi:hypothetical protein
MRDVLKICAGLCLVASLNTGLRAQQAKTPATGVKAMACNPDTDLNCHPAAISEIIDPFRGLKWGLGVAYSSSLGGVGNVVVDPTTKIVHVQKENAGAARGIFEAHYFWKFCNASNLGGPPVHLPNEFHRLGNTQGVWECPVEEVPFGMGPFVSLNTSPFDTSGSSSSSKLFDSVGAGWMIGLNAYDPTKSTGLQSLNFGIGVIIDTGVQVLAPGVVDGQVTTLPQSYLIRSVTKTGFMALLTYKILDVSVK